MPCRRARFFAPGGRYRTSPWFFPVSGIAGALACSAWPPAAQRLPPRLLRNGGERPLPRTGRRDTCLSLRPGLSPCTARPPRGREEARSAGRWGSFEGWRKTTPPCEERGAAARRDEHFPQTMTGEVRAGHGRLRSRTGGEDQADATTGGSVVCRWRVQTRGFSLGYKFTLVIERLRTVRTV